MGTIKTNKEEEVKGNIDQLEQLTEKEIKKVMNQAEKEIEASLENDAKQVEKDVIKEKLGFIVSDSDFEKNKNGGTDDLLFSKNSNDNDGNNSNKGKAIQKKKENPVTGDSKIKFEDENHIDVSTNKSNEEKK